MAWTESAAVVAPFPLKCSSRGGRALLEQFDGGGEAGASDCGRRRRRERATHVAMAPPIPIIVEPTASETRRSGARTVIMRRDAATSATIAHSLQQGWSGKHDAFAASRLTVDHRGVVALRRRLHQDQTYIYLRLTRCPLFGKSRKDIKVLKRKP